MSSKIWAFISIDCYRKLSANIILKALHFKKRPNKSAEVFLSATKVLLLQIIFNRIHLTSVKFEIIFLSDERNKRIHQMQREIRN